MPRETVLTLFEGFGLYFASCCMCVLYGFLHQQRSKMEHYKGALVLFWLVHLRSHDYGFLVGYIINSSSTTGEGGYVGCRIEPLCSHILFSKFFFDCFRHFSLPTAPEYFREPLMIPNQRQADLGAC